MRALYWRAWRVSLALSLARALTPSLSTRRHALVALGASTHFTFATSTWAIDKTTARAQLTASRDKLDRVLAHYDAIIAGGGDALRRELGFVGTSSSLLMIDRALLALSDDATDVAQYSEQQEDLLLALRAADADAYSSNFVGYSSAKGTPAGYFKSARKELVRALADLDGVLSLLPQLR